MDFETPTLELFSKGIGHADFHVRNECLSYLSRHTERSQAHGREVLAQLAIHGPGFYEYAHQAVELPIGKTEIHELSTFCRQMLDAGDDENAARYLRWLLRVEDALLPEALGALKQFDPDAFSHGYTFLALDELETDLEARIEVSQLSADETADRLGKLTEEMAGTDSFPHEDWATCKLLADRLTRKDAVDAGRAVATEWLQLDYDPKESGPHDWKLLTAATLSGRLKMENAAGKLLEFLKADWDTMNEEVERAFSRMNSSAALETIRSAWPELRDYEQLYLSSCFERVHPMGFDDFYEQILLESDDEPYTGINIARALMHTGQRASLDAARDYLDGFHPEDPEALGGFETLYAHYILRDYELDDAAGIESRLSDRQRRLEERRRSINEAFIPHQPIRKPAKVGRNDPCPCGSGKKYKKCCL